MGIKQRCFVKDDFSDFPQLIRNLPFIPLFTWVLKQLPIFFLIFVCNILGRHVIDCFAKNFLHRSPDELKKGLIKACIAAFGIFMENGVRDGVN